MEFIIVYFPFIIGNTQKNYYDFRKIYHGFRKNYCDFRKIYYDFWNDFMNILWKFYEGFDIILLRIL